MRNKNLIQQCLLSIVILLLGLSSSHAGVRVTYYHNDLIGNPIAASNESGEVLWRQHYQPYGQTDLPDSRPASDQRIGYTGHSQDPDTGLVYMGARYYDPAIGRFLGIDPQGYRAEQPMSFNPYIYANNNPYRYVDPNGEVPVETIWDIANVALGAASCYSNFNEGNYGYAIIDGIGVVIDTAAAVLPYIPGGAGTIIKTSRATQVAGDLVKESRAGKAVGKVDDAAGAALEPNRIYSARELIRRADEPGPFHNFPESFNTQIFKQGERRVISDRYIQYDLKGSLNGRSGTYELGVKPSASGRTEVITHRFFRPDIQ